MAKTDNDARLLGSLSELRELESFLLALPLRRRKIGIKGMF